jgi:hypothetical protein
MLQILEATSQALNAIKFEGMTLPDRQPGSVVHHWRPALDAVQELSKIEALKPETRAVLNLGWSHLVGEPATVGAPVSTPMGPAIGRLQLAASLLQRMIDSLLPAETAPTISVKLPQPQNLQEFENLVEAINLSVARPADVLFGPCIQFSNVDAGSTWIDLIVETVKTPEGASAAVIAGSVAVGSARKNILGFLGGLVELYGKLVRMRQRQRIVEAHLRSLEMTSAVDESAEKHAAEAKKVASEEVERIVRLYGADSEHRADAIPVALKATQFGPDLLERGAEIHARLAASNSKRGGPVEGWPDPNEIRQLVSSPIAQLPETTSKREAETASRRHDGKDRAAEDS